MAFIRQTSHGETSGVRVRDVFDSLAAIERSDDSIEGLILQLQRDVRLLAEEIRRSGLAAGTKPGRYKPDAELPRQILGGTSHSPEKVASANEDMPSAIEDVWRAGAEITTALDASRVS
jgi:hypothetical protein